MDNAISKFMTKSPHTIGINATLAEARERMNEHGVRHLPVLEAGALVGLLSQRDIQLLETFKDVDAKEVRVEEAMSQDVLSVTPETSVPEVAKKMAMRVEPSSRFGNDPPCSAPRRICVQRGIHMKNLRCRPAGGV